MSRLLLGFVVVAASMTVAEGAQAAPEGPGSNTAARVLLLRTGCERSSFDEEGLARILRVELAGHYEVDFAQEGAGESPPPGSSSVSLSLQKDCSFEDVIVVVSASSSGVPATRPLPLAAVAKTLRERTVALAIAEILRAGRGPESVDIGEEAEKDQMTASAIGGVDNPQLDRVTHAKARGASPLPAGAASGRIHVAPDSLRDRDSLPPSALPVFVSAGIEWRFLFEHEAALTGARLGGSIPLRLRSRWIARISGDGAIFYDGDKDPEAETGLWLLSGSLGASAGYSWGGAEITAGPRIELAYCDARYRPREPDARTIVASGPAVIASAVASGRVELAAKVWISLDIELGYTLRGFVAPTESRSPLGIEGLIGSGRAAMALAF